MSAPTPCQLLPSTFRVTLPNAIVVVNADNNANYQSVIRVMDAARQAGYGQVAFAVEQTTK